MEPSTGTARVTTAQGWIQVVKQKMDDGDTMGAIRDLILVVQMQDARIEDLQRSVLKATEPQITIPGHRGI